MIPTPLLDTIDYPQELRRLDKSQLPQLAEEVRAFLLDSINRTGGHFASNLGTVELTIALHYVYNTPDDKIIWDVGHQSYAHKILTGRKAAMHTIRKPGGLSGFPKRDESEYDAFGTGHSSTSISAALGMAVADKLAGKPWRSVAVIGDGAMTAGEAFEALNNAGTAETDLLIILNDNEMSISPNVGALPRYLADNPLSEVKKLAKAIKKKSEKLLEKMPGALDVALQVESRLKSLIDDNANKPQALFNSFGIHYTGPTDGHDVLELVAILQQMRTKKGPQLLHVLTQKGKGYAPAEDNPVKYHAIAPGALDPGIRASTPEKKTTYTDVFSQWIVDKAAEDSRLIAITPAMKEGSGLTRFAEQFPDRYFDVGIAEQHAVTFAAGLACEGMKPVVAIYSTFLQRAYDQVIHDVGLQNLPVLFAVDRAGFVGADGPTHDGIYDLTFMSCVPNMIIATPSDSAECEKLLTACYETNSPAAVRYPRGEAQLLSASEKTPPVEIGKGFIRRQGNNIALLAFGSMVAIALEVAEELNATVVDMRFAKPLDNDLVVSLSFSHNYIFSLEENVTDGGTGSVLLENYKTNKNLFIINIYNHTPKPEMYKPYMSKDNFDSQFIVEIIDQTIKKWERFPAS